MEKDYRFLDLVVDLVVAPSLDCLSFDSSAAVVAAAAAVVSEESGAAFEVAAAEDCFVAGAVPVPQPQPQHYL